MVYFAIIGFLGSYLLARLFLQGAFEEQDSFGVREEPAQLNLAGSSVLNRLTSSACDARASLCE